MFRGEWLIHQWEVDLSWEKNQKKGFRKFKNNINRHVKKDCQLRKKYSQKKEEERNKKIYDFE